MESLELTARLAAGILLTALNALFVLTEFALTRAPHLGKEAFSSHASLRLAWKMTSKLEIYLTGCQLGISSTSVLLGIVAEPAVTHLMRPLAEVVGASGTTLQVVSITLAVVVINLIHKIWGEQAPTYFGVEEPAKAARLGAPFLYVWTHALYPLVMAGDGLAKLTLRPFGVRVTRSWQAADSDGQATASDDRNPSDRSPGTTAPRTALLRSLARLPIDAERKREVLGAYDIAETRVEDIMVPRDKIAYLSTRTSIEENLQVVRDHPKSRYPLSGTHLEDAVGMIYAPALIANITDLLEGRCRLEDLAVDAMSVDAGTMVDALVDLLQENRQEIAFVRDKGQILGLVTQTDAFERIVGSLEDPLDTFDGKPRPRHTRHSGAHGLVR